MIEFLQHTPAEQRQAFLLTAQKKHLPEPSIEKDWWSNYPDNYTEYYPKKKEATRSDHFLFPFLYR